METVLNAQLGWSLSAAMAVAMLSGVAVGVVNAGFILYFRIPSLIVTLGTGIGSGLFVDGKLVANTELGHLHLHHGDAEEFASDAARERDNLSWEEYAHRLQHYLELLQRLFWPSLIIIGGGISKKADKYLPHITLDTEVIPASLQNDAGIVGAAMVAPVG